MSDTNGQDLIRDLQEASRSETDQLVSPTGSIVYDLGRMGDRQPARIIHPACRFNA